MVSQTAAGEPLNPAEMALIRQASAVTVRSEQLQIAIVRGEAIDG